MPVDTDGDLDELSAVLVPHVDAVLAGVVGSDLVDDKTGELAAVKRDLGVLGGGDFLLVLEPGDLRGWLAPHSAGQAQRLQRVKSQVNNRTHYSRYKSMSFFSITTVEVCGWFSTCGSSPLKGSCD